MKNIGLLTSSTLPDIRLKTLKPILTDCNFLIKISLIDTLPKLTLIFVGGFGILKKKLLNVTPFVVLSYHHSDMRKYCGIPTML